MKTQFARNIKWDRLDNTAHVFPVVAGESMTNVYRVSAVLKEKIEQDILQRALEIVLPKFPMFNIRLRMGFFWYYFEENGKTAPKVTLENEFPCRYIHGTKNNSYLFRLTYYDNRINLEVFHAVTDGMGALTFLKELVCQYIALKHEFQIKDDENYLSKEVSLSKEDGFLKNYREAKKKSYKSGRAFLIKGERLAPGEFGVIHGHMNIEGLKEVAKKYEVTLNELLVATFLYSIYHECLNRKIYKRPIRVAVPVNLRGLFHSNTMKNFFAMVSAEMYADAEEGYTFSQVVEKTKLSLREQITKEHLEDIFSYNVSNEKVWIARAVPLPIKNFCIKMVYNTTALANTTTMTNIGNVRVPEEYMEYVDYFYGLLAMSKGQFLKGTLCSTRDDMVVSFSSVLADTSIQKCFFSTLSAEGVEVTIETNGVYNELL